MVRRCIAVLGAAAIVQTPQILAALNPAIRHRAVRARTLDRLRGLGSVVLAVTGCEALYADMGHFGRQPIRWAWLYRRPARAAAELFRPRARCPVAIRSWPRFRSSPWRRIGRIIRWWSLATIATIIASQAVISGVFSITQQAVQLGQLPRMEIRHTSATDYGQIYVPRINVLLAHRRGADRADLQAVPTRWPPPMASRSPA